MTARNSCFYCNTRNYLGYLDKLVDVYNNNQHRFVSKKPIDGALIKKNQANLKTSKFKVFDRVRITKYKNSFSKGYTNNWSREVFLIDSAMKTYEIIFLFQ